MVPFLLPGDEFVANTEAIALPGDVVAVEHPGRPEFWLAKRLAGVGGDTVEDGAGRRVLDEGEGWVISDNPGSNAIDSKSFGPVAIDRAFPMVHFLDDDTFRKGVALLTSEDQSLSGVVERFGVPAFWSRPRGFRTMTILILEQQVSLESAASVFHRIQDQVGEVSPESIVASSIEALNMLGVTRQKARYIFDLATRVIDGSVDFDSLTELPTGEARAVLEEIRGVGTWTADAYLLSAEGRLDIFPVGDRALQVATGEVLGMARPADPAELAILSEPWRPLRSVAARLLWHDYLSRRRRSEPVYR